jgi:single-stranded DNA-binding protein
VARLLQLKAGAAVSLAGALKVGTWQAKDGTTRPQLDLVADEVASTTPRPRKPKAQAGSAPAGDPFCDLPGAGDVDWMGA